MLPGSFLAREARGVNPGANFVRIALVAELEETLEAAQRINLKNAVDRAKSQSRKVAKKYK